MEDTLDLEEIKSIKNKIKTLRPIIKDYQKKLNDNQHQVDIIVNKYKKNKKFICIGCCKKFYNQKDYDLHVNKNIYGCRMINYNSYSIFSFGVGDYDRNLYKFIRETKVSEHYINNKRKELDKLLKQLEDNKN
jgi:hypothetical protein